MTKEEIQEYSLRITQGNKSDLVVTTYDIILKYLEDAGKKYQEGDREQFAFHIRKANEFLAELMGALDLQYPVSRELMNIYRFVQKMFMQAMFQKEPSSLEGLEQILSGLREAFAEVAKQDNSQPLAGGKGQVYAGLTYGRESLNETYEPNPGFMA